MWLHRRAFDLPGQTFKQFYAEIVKSALLCQFGNNFCGTDKIQEENQLLVKVVYGSADISAQRKLIQKTDLTLASAIRFTESCQSLQNLPICLQIPGLPLYNMYVMRMKLQT